MIQLAIPIPHVEGKQDIEIEMTVNGQPQKIHFIVDVYKWDKCDLDPENRVKCIRELVKDYGDDWMIYNIGIPTDNYIPLTFVKTEDWFRQRKLLLESVVG